MKIIFADRCEVLPKELKDFAEDIEHEYNLEIRTWYFLVEIPYKEWNIESQDNRSKENSWDASDYSPQKKVFAGATLVQGEILKLFYSIEVKANPSFVNIPQEFHQNILDHYCTWVKDYKTQTVYFKMRIRYEGDINNHKVGGQSDHWYHWTNTANSYIGKESHYTREFILDRFISDTEQFWGDCKKYKKNWDEEYCDLRSWWYGNEHKIYEDENGWYVFHLQRDDEENEDFLNFCRDQLVDVVVHELETKIECSKFYKISGSIRKDSFTLKMFSV